MSGASSGATRAWLRASFGIWPLFEARNKALGWPRRARGHASGAPRGTPPGRACQVPTALVTTILPTYRRPESLVACRATAPWPRRSSEHVVVVVDDGGGLPELPDDPRLVAVSLSRNVRTCGRRCATSASRSRELDLPRLPRRRQRVAPPPPAVALRGPGGDAEIVYTGMERVHPDGTVLDVLSRPFDRRALAEEAYVDTNCIVVRRATGRPVQPSPPVERDAAQEDWELVWRLSRRLSGPARARAHRHATRQPRTATYMRRRSVTTTDDEPPGGPRVPAVGRAEGVADLPATSSRTSSPRSTTWRGACLARCAPVQPAASRAGC